MPKITNEDVLEFLKDPFFDAHAAMHLAREGMIQPPPYAFKMTPVGEPGSGREFLDMHHDLLRVFRYFIQTQNLKYEPEKWDLDDPEELPSEIRDLFRNTNRPDYLSLVFCGTAGRIQDAGTGKFDDAADDLGRFLEKGDDGETPGSGLHDTLHSYLGSKEGGFARGAEMNKLRQSMNNDYFWALHTWIDAQYVRLAVECGQKLETTPLAPQDARMHNMGSMKMAAGSSTTGGGMKMAKAPGGP